MTATKTLESPTQTGVGTVRSKDGTVITFDKTGSGPAVILVDGALCSRTFGPAPDLAPLLAPHFTVYAYDRRGRGESGDTQPYAVEREIEDLEAVIGDAGGSASLFGLSSGAVLALQAANRGLAVDKLAMYEAPFFVDDRRPPAGDECAQIEALLAADRRGAAVKVFLRLVGVPSIALAVMPLMVPVWSKLKAVAHTLPYDLTIMAGYQRGKPLPPGEWDAVTAPALVMGGSKSTVWMKHAVEATADAVPGARQRTLDGQTHNVKAKVLAPVLTEFFE